MQLSTGGTYAGGYTYAPAAAGQVVFSCGCTAQAGTTNADGSGSFTLVQNSTATPSAPNPTYTIVPGRNYVIIAQGGAGAQAWTTQFAGKVPAHNLYLGGTNASDVFTAAVSLYVFQESTNGSEAFDDWNFYNLQAWYNALKTSPNAQETTLLNDIAAQSALSKSLYPSHPTWNPSQMTNVTIFNDLNAVKGSGDATIPTPCPTNGAGDAACTGAPSP